MPSGKGANDLNHQKDPTAISNVGVQQQNEANKPSGKGANGLKLAQ